MGAMRAVEQTELGALWPHLSPSAGSAVFERVLCSISGVAPKFPGFYPQALQLPKFSLSYSFFSKLRSLVPCCSLFLFLPRLFCSLCLWSCALVLSIFFLSALPRKCL